MFNGSVFLMAYFADGGVIESEPEQELRIDQMSYSCSYSKVCSTLVKPLYIIYYIDCLRISGFQEVCVQCFLAPNFFSISLRRTFCSRILYKSYIFRFRTFQLSAILSAISLPAIYIWRDTHYKKKSFCCSASVELERFPWSGSNSL